MRLRSTIFAGLSATAAACAVGPHYRPPATPAAASRPFVSASPGATVAQPVPRLWWRLYDDPVLDRLVAEALTENADLKVAAANLAYAQGLLQEAKAGRYPTTDLTAGYGYGRSSLQVFADQPAGFGYSAGFSASYQIDLFGRIRRTIQAARANAESVAAAEDVVRVTVAAETAGAYADICGFAEEAATARDSLAVVQKTYDITLIERNAGSLSDLDLEREAVLLAQAKAAIPPIEGERRVALFTLAALVGKTPAEVPADAAACHDSPRVAQALPVGDGAALLRRRPDVRQAERALAANVARIGVAAADLYPTVTFGGMVANGGPNIGELFNPGTATFQVGPMLSWTFPNILVAKAHVKEATAQAQGAVASFDGVVLTALKETEQALSTYGEEIAHNDSLRQARAHAQAALRLATIQFNAGALNFLDLLQAQAAEVNADAAVAQSDHTLSSDQVAVFQALGGGWEEAPAVIPPPIPKK